MRKLVLLFVTALMLLGCNSKEMEFKDFLENEVGKEVVIVSADKEKSYLVPTGDKEQYYLDIRDIGKGNDYCYHVKYRIMGTTDIKSDFILYWGTNDKPYMLGSELVKEYKKLKK